MMPFSIEIGLKRVEIAGPVRWLWTLDFSIKQETKRIDEGSLVASQIPKSVLSQPMMPFSIGTGLERVGIAGSVRWLWILDFSAKTRNKEDRRGLARCLSDA